MATTNVNAKTELIFLNEICDKEYLSKKDIKVIRQLIKNGTSRWLNAGTVTEDAIIYMSKNKLKGESVNGKDFTDLSDAKTATVVEYVNKRKNLIRSAKIDCKGKLGDIRLWVYEPKSKQFYYFYVPRNAYKKIITIPFNLDGTPKNIFLYKDEYQEKYNEFWQWEVESFAEMAKCTKNRKRSNRFLTWNKKYAKKLIEKYEDYVNKK
jgi:hypothetical protein